MKTTEQLVRKIFCRERDCFCESLYCGNAPCPFNDSKRIARAARRFVKAEQREKLHNRIRRQFKGKCKIVVEKGGYNLQDALKRAEQRERKHK